VVRPNLVSLKISLPKATDNWGDRHEVKLLRGSDERQAAVI